jgi:hypothetical protein
VEVQPRGRYVTTPEGLIWRSEEYELAGRKSEGRRTATIAVPLVIQKPDGRDLRPAEERVLIKFFMRRHTGLEPKLIGQFAHAIWID